MTDAPTSPLPQPREPGPVTPESIKAHLISEHYFTAFDGAVQSGVNRGEQSAAIVGALQHTMICTLVFRNGFAVVGVAPCLYRESYDPQLAQEAARGDALAQAVRFVHFIDRQRIADEDFAAGKSADKPAINSPAGDNIRQLRRSP